MVRRKRTEETILDELREVGAEIEGHNGTLEDLYDRRIRLWQEGRSMDPPVKVGDLGAAAGVGEAAVINGLRKRREAEEAAG